MRYIFCVLVLSLFLGSSCRVLAGEEEKTIIFGYSEWKPLFYLNKDNAPQGIYAEVLEELFEKKLGYNLVYQVFPWKRCQLYLEDGTIDFTIMLPSKERTAYAVKSENVFYDFYMNVFTYRGHPKIQEIEKIHSVADIKRHGLKPVTNLGNGWHKKNIDAHGVETIYLGKEAQIFQFLSAKRADIVIDVLAPSLHLIREHNLQSSIQVTAARFGPARMHLMMSKLSKHGGLLPAIDKAFDELEEEGVIRRIIDKYERSPDLRSAN